MQPNAFLCLAASPLGTLPHTALLPQAWRAAHASAGQCHRHCSGKQHPYALACHHQSEHSRDHESKRHATIYTYARASSHHGCPDSHLPPASQKSIPCCLMTQSNAPLRPYSTHTPLTNTHKPDEPVLYCTGEGVLHPSLAGTSKPRNS